MGAIKLQCITADPRQITLFGLAYGYSSSEARANNRPDKIMLIRSQEMPTNIEDILWNVVSTLSQSTELTSMTAQKNPEFACAMSTGGFFTALSWDNSESRYQVLQGIHYNSRDKEWRAVAVAQNYSQAERPSYNGHKIAYYFEGGQREALLHAYTSPVDASSPPAVHIGFFNETGRYPVLEHRLTYRNDNLQIDSMPTFAFGYNHLYTYAPGPKPQMLGISLINMDPAFKGAIKRFNATSSSDCQYPQYQGLKAATWKDTYFLLCSQLRTDSDRPYYNATLQSINSTLTDTRTTKLRFNGDYQDTNSLFKSSLQPIGGYRDGQETFGVLNGALGIQSLTLTGPNTGDIQGITTVRIDGVEGFEHEAQASSDPQSGSSSQISIGAWIGIAFGVLIVALASVYAVRRYRQSRGHAAQCSELSKIEENHPAIGPGHKTLLVEDEDTSQIEQIDLVPTGSSP